MVKLTPESPTSPLERIPPTAYPLCELTPPAIAPQGRHLVLTAPPHTAARRVAGGTAGCREARLIEAGRESVVVIATPKDPPWPEPKTLHWSKDLFS